MKILHARMLVPLVVAPAHAADGRLIPVDSRPGVTVSYYCMERPVAKGALILLPEGKRGIGMKDGAPPLGSREGRDAVALPIHRNRQQGTFFVMTAKTIILCL
jgi:hypothetical protein